MGFQSGGFYTGSLNYCQMLGDQLTRTCSEHGGQRITVLSISLLSFATLPHRGFSRCLVTPIAIRDAASFQLPGNTTFEYNFHITGSDTRCTNNSTIRILYMSLNRSQKSAENEFNYTQHQKEEFWKFLKSAGIQPGITKRDVLHQITQAARCALLQKPLPYTGAIQSEFKTLSTSIDKFLTGLTLSPLAHGLLEAYFHTRSQSSLGREFMGQVGMTRTLLFIQLLLKTFQEGLNAQEESLKPNASSKDISPDTQKEAIDYLPAEVQAIINQSRKTEFPGLLGLPHRGPPVKRKQEVFAYLLCAIFFEVTGKLPKISFNAYAGKPSGHFYEFATAAIRPTCLLKSKKTPVALLKKTCQNFNPPSST